MNEQTPLQKLIFDILYHQLIKDINNNQLIMNEPFTQRSFDLLLIEYYHNEGYNSIYNLYVDVIEKLKIMKEIFMNFPSLSTYKQDYYDQECFEITGYKVNTLFLKLIN